MKTKSFFTLICTIILTLCFYSAAFANNAKTQAVNFLKQATQNTLKTQNAAYSIKLSMTGPLADCNVNLNGNYAYPVLTDGNMSIALDLWIIDTTFNAQTEYYSEIEGSVYKQYFKTKTNPKTDNINPEIKSDQWYVQTINIPEKFSGEFKEQINESVDNVGKNVKNIFMYDVDENTTKIYVTYKKPLLDEEKLNEAMSISTLNEDEMEKVNELSQKLDKNKKLKNALTKPRDLSYEITVDKKNMLITAVNADLSSTISEMGTDILNSISDEDLSTGDDAVNGATVRNIIKNYLERSKFKLEIKLSDFNNAPVKAVPQEIKDSAVAPETENIGTGDEKTDITVTTTDTAHIPLEILTK